MPRPLSECQELIVATTNPNKYREFSTLLTPLGVPILPLPKDANLTPVEEDGQTLRENCTKKAVGYAQQLQRWVIADDTGLLVDALDGAPGVRSARFAGENATAAENLAFLIEKIRHVPMSERTARFICTWCVADPLGEIAIEGMATCLGKIIWKPIGEHGFGYDSLFQVDGMEKTLAQLTEEETAQVGHRGQAARALVDTWLRR